MIERIRIENFKSLRDVNVTLGRLNLFIGTNASGKSNFFDALRVLQGIGNGFTISEILDGKPKSATSEVWDGSRGGSAKACFAGGAHGSEVSITVTGKREEKPSQSWEFMIAFSPSEGKVTREKLRVHGEIYDSEAVTKNLPGDPVFEVRYYRGEKGRQPHLKFERSRAVLGQFAKANGKWKKSDAELVVRSRRFWRIHNASTHRLHSCEITHRRTKFSAWVNMERTLRHSCKPFARTLLPRMRISRG